MSEIVKTSSLDFIQLHYLKENKILLLNKYLVLV